MPLVENGTPLHVCAVPDVKDHEGRWYAVTPTGAVEVGPGAVWVCPPCRLTWRLSPAGTWRRRRWFRR